jgi:bacteriocin biosynthesis cyclodehydratase domain-containing protein
MKASTQTVVRPHPQRVTVREGLRVIEDIAVFAMPDGLGVQIRGAGAPIVFRGEAVGAALPFLLARLDGRRTLGSILREGHGNLPAKTLMTCVRLLEEAGLLVSSTGARRPLGVAGANVTLITTGLFGRETRALLERSGCRHLGVLAWDDAPSNAQRAFADERLATTSIPRAMEILKPWIAKCDLVVTATRNAPDALFAEINRACLERRVPWLRANDAAGTLEIGPTILPFESACFACLSLRATSANDLAIEERLYQDHLATERPAGETAPRAELVPGAALGASLIALEATRILSRVSVPQLVDAVWSVAPLDGAIERGKLLRVPRCPACSRTSNVSGGAHV